MHAQVVANGQFGWLAFGHENPGGGHSGMDGGHIVMALPGTDFDEATGLDLSGGPNVAEYVINEHGGAAFRHWKTPFSPSALQASAVEADDCFTTLTFSSDKIAGKPLAPSPPGEETYVLKEANPSPNPNPTRTRT